MESSIETRETALSTRRGSQVARVDDYDQQKALADEMMARLAMHYGENSTLSSDSYVLKFQLVKREDGTIVASPRERPFKVTSEDIIGINLMMRSPYSDRIGLDGAGRGRYNDEDRLLLNEYGTAEIGEVAPVGSVG